MEEKCFDVSCLDTLDLRQSTFAQWRFEQCQTSCFVDTKLLDTIHLEHDNMVQRCIGATILRSENYMARRPTSTNTLNCSFTLLAGPLLAKILDSKEHVIFFHIWWDVISFDEFWEDVFMFGYLWPLTSTSECVGSVVPVQSAAEVGCCCIHKSQSKGVRGPATFSISHAAHQLTVVAETAWSTCLHPWHKRIQMVHILHNLLGLIDLQHLWNR